MFELLQALRLNFEKAHVERELHTTEVYHGQLRRLQQLHRHQSFSNSCMLPTMHNFRVSDEDALSYWRDHKGPLTFDCCPLHRSRKQNLLRIGADSVDCQAMASVRALQKYHSAAQAEIRRKACLEPFAADDSDVIRRRIFRAGDCQSLRYQLRLIDQRLQRMLKRKQIAENFAPPPAESEPAAQFHLQVAESAPSSSTPEAVQPSGAFVPPIDTGRVSMREPVDIWYDLADNRSTPPIVLHWLSAHRNPYIANRACKTLNFLSKAS